MPYKINSILWSVRITLIWIPILLQCKIQDKTKEIVVLLLTLSFQKRCVTYTKDGFTFKIMCITQYTYTML